MDQPVQRMDGLAVVRTSGPAFNHVHIPSAATARPQGLNNAVEASFAACRLSGEGGKVPASTSMGVAPIIFAAKPDEGEMRRSSQQVTTFLALWNGRFLQPKGHDTWRPPSCYGTVASSHPARSCR